MSVLGRVTSDLTTQGRAEPGSRANRSGGRRTRTKGVAIRTELGALAGPGLSGVKGSYLGQQKLNPGTGRERQCWGRPAVAPEPVCFQSSRTDRRWRRGRGAGVRLARPPGPSAVPSLRFGTPRAAWPSRPREKDARGTLAWNQWGSPVRPSGSWAWVRGAPARRPRPTPHGPAAAPRATDGGTRRTARDHPGPATGGSRRPSVGTRRHGP